MMVVAIVSKGLAMNGGKRTDFSNELYTITVKGNDYASERRYEGMGVSFHLFDVC